MMANNRLKVALTFDDSTMREYLFPAFVRGVRDSNLMRATGIAVYGDIDTKEKREWFYKDILMSMHPKTDLSRFYV